LHSYIPFTLLPLEGVTFYISAVSFKVPTMEDIEEVEEEVKVKDRKSRRRS